MRNVPLIYIPLKIQPVLELDFWAVKFLFFPRRDLSSHHINSIYYHFDVVTQLHTQTHGLIKYYGNANNIRLKRITCKNKDCLARIHVSVPACSDMSTHGLLFQWASTIKLQLRVGLEQDRHHHHYKTSTKSWSRTRQTSSSL
jgi:hypothetical protein